MNLGVCNELYRTSILSNSSVLTSFFNVLLFADNCVLIICIFLCSSYSHSVMLIILLTLMCTLARVSVLLPAYLFGGFCPINYSFIHCLIESLNRRIPCRIVESNTLSNRCNVKYLVEFLFAGFGV